MTEVALAPAWSPRQRRKNDRIFALARVGVGVARACPGWLLRAVGRGIGALAYVVAAEARATAVANVRRALGLGAFAAHCHVARTFVTLGRNLGDTLELLGPTTRAGDRLVLPTRAREVLGAALRGGRGAVLVTAHHGLWEHLAAALVEGGFPLTTPVRRSYDPRLEALVHAPLRDARGVRTIDRDDPHAGVALLRALRAGSLVGFLVDLNGRGAALEAPFLGIPAWTTTAPARLARAASVPIVVACAVRGRVVVERLDVEDPSDVAGVTAAINAAVSAHVRAAPHEWVWMHPRFSPPRAGP